jgi:hypothetical protein
MGPYHKLRAFCILVLHKQILEKRMRDEALRLRHASSRQSACVVHSSILQGIYLRMRDEALRLRDEA